MAELGDEEIEMHKRIGEFIEDKPVYELITVGQKQNIYLIR